MLSLVIVLALAGLFMMVAAVAAGVYLYRRPVSSEPLALGRSKLIELASKAASDDQGHSVLQLLATLEAMGEPQPVSVRWWAHKPADGRPSGLMLTLTWDGNEWRRVLLPSMLAAYAQAAQSAPPSAAGQRLLADLQAAQA